jgi:branched-chain amino acid transport system substrate-binding protein
MTSQTPSRGARRAGGSSRWWQPGPRGAAAAACAITLLAVAGCSSSSNDSAGDSSSGSKGTIDTSRCPSDATKKFSGDSISIGGTGALSGQFALTGDIAKGAGAYFDHVNDAGGVKTVDGTKTIDFTLLDDQYTASVTQTKVRELVEKDNVDLLAGIVGTAPNVAVAPYVTSKCVPLLWGSNGADETLGDDYPFVTQVQSYSNEGRIVGKHIAEKMPDATIAVLYQNDDIGAGILAGLKEGIAGSNAEIVESQSTEQTDTDVRSQMTTLEASNADVFLNAGVTNKCPQALDSLAGSSWKPKAVYFTINCPPAYLSQAKSAADPHPEWLAPQYFQPLEGDDAAVTEFKDAMAKAGLDATSQTYLGWNIGALTVLTLEEAKELTRVGVAEAAIALDKLPDTFRTAPTRNTDGERVSTINLQVAPWDSSITDFAAGGDSVDLAK